MVIVLFRAKLRPGIDTARYEEVAGRMFGLVSAMPGFVSIDAFQQDGAELVVARFESHAAVEEWRRHPDHIKAQQLGRELFFAEYSIAVCEPMREYGWQLKES